MARIWSYVYFYTSHQKRELGLTAWLRPVVFIPWVRGGAYSLHVATRTQMGFCKLREKKDVAAG